MGYICVLVVISASSLMSVLMGIPFEKLAIPKWEGTTPDRVTREACVLSPECVIDPPVVLSPMAAVTNPPFRMICRELGAGLVVTEMIHADGLVRGDKRSMEMLDLRPSERPVSVQLYGKDPQVLAQAAQIVQQAGAASVDLNMGCPMRKVVSSGHGAALLKRPDLVYEIFEAMSRAVDIPVTGKIRAGWEDSSALEVGQAMQAAGAAAVTIHGRTRCDFYDGHADLGVIRELVQALKIPVIGNGDVRDYVTARRMFSVTGCAAVMVARGALGNPWVFSQIAADLRGEPVPAEPSVDERRRVIMRHVGLYVETYGEQLACQQLRKHLLWYFRQTPGELVLRRAMNQLVSQAQVIDAVDAALLANAQALAS